MRPDISDPTFIGALIYFDQAAAKQSFAAAADALHVTPSAVSHRIKALEDALGHKLFWRDVRSVHLTAEGAELARTTNAALSQIRETVENISRRRVLNVYVGPYLAAMWLMERLKDFEQKHPGLQINLVHDARKFIRDVDVSVTWEAADALGPDAHILFDDAAALVAAPGTYQGEDIWSGTLDPIHYQDREAWQHWLASVGGPLEFAERGQVYNDPSLVFQSAAHGRGVAIGFLPFAANMIKDGQLIQIAPTRTPALRVYTVSIKDRARSDALLFFEWIKMEGRGETLNIL